MNISDYIQREVSRQHSTKFHEFSNALNYAEIGAASFAEVKLTGIPMPQSLWNLPRQKALQVFVMNIAELVEPEVNAQTMFDGNIRQSHVGFISGGKAAPANEVKYRFERWASIWSEYIFDPIKMSESEVDSCVKMLLEIHPWKDGNGRTASIFRNWLLGTLSDPQFLPYYFGE